MHTFIQCPPGQQLQTYGKGDGTKQLCDLQRLTTPPCVVYSLGSNGDYSFERDILAVTKCKVHTFDCTYDGKSIDPERHTYHKLCVGNKPGDPSFKTWGEITRSLGHQQQIDVAKIDIEGHETSVLSELRHDTVLPRQLVMEIHIKAPGVDLPDVAARTPAQVALMFLHLANLGYGVINRADNLYGHRGCCAEFAFLHVERRWHQGGSGSGRGPGRRGGRGSSRLRVERARAASSLAAAGAGAAAANPAAAALAAAAAAAQAAAETVAAASGAGASEATQQLLLEATASSAAAAAAAASAAAAAADSEGASSADTTAADSSTSGGGR